MKKFFTLFLFSMIAFNAIHAEINWTLSDDGTLTISGTDMPNYELNSSGPWYSQREKIKKIVIENGVTYIGSNAFQNCYRVTSITVPNSVTSIGESAFRSCRGLTSVHIKNLVSWCKIKFEVTNSTESYLCTNPLYYAHHLYLNGKEIIDLALPDGLKTISPYAFVGLTTITSVSFPNSIESIDNSAFYGCYNLQSITVNKVIPPSMGSYVFGCPTGVRDAYDVYSYATLHIPMGSKEAYSSAREWRYFNKIKEDMEQNGKVYYAKLAVKQGTTGYTEQPVKADETYTIYIGSLGNSKINAVTFNGEDVTDQVKDGYYTTPEIKAKSVLSISYEDINTTNVKEISNPDLKVTGNEGEINITGIEQPTNVEVYTTDGKLVETRGSVYGDTNIQVKEDNLYLVKVGKRAIKIAM